MSEMLCDNCGKEMRFDGDDYSCADCGFYP